MSSFNQTYLSIPINYANSATDKNYQFSYKLPKPLILNKHEVGIHSTSIYNAIPNIHSKYGNTKLYYKISWAPYNTQGPNNDGVFEVDLSQGTSTGMMSFTDINGVLQTTLINNKHYLVNSTTGANVYFLNIQSNPLYDRLVFTSTPVPNSITGYTNPGSFTLPAANTTIQFSVTTNGAASLYGFPIALYPSAPQSAYFSQLSPNIPQISQVHGLTLRSNLCLISEYITISNFLCDIPINAPFNSEIDYQPPNITWVRCPNSQFTEIEITICDQNGNALDTLLENFTTKFKIFIRPL